MKYFYLILVFILFIPFNLIAQYEFKELNDSILKPNIIDFSKCSCIDSTSNLNYCSEEKLLNLLYQDSKDYLSPEPLSVKINDAPSIDVINSYSSFFISIELNDKPHMIQIWDSPVSCERMGALIKNYNGLLNSSLKVFKLSLSLGGTCGATGAGEYESDAIAYIIFSNNKYYIWSFEINYKGAGSNQGKGDLFETSEESGSRTIKLSNDTLYISKWYVHYKREGLVNDTRISEKNSAFNRVNAKEYSENKNDTIGGDLIYKFEFPNFVRVNH